MSNRSRPNIFSTLRYRDTSAAVEWLRQAFGFEEKAVHRAVDGTVEHAELRLDGGIVMLGQHSDGWMGGKKLDALASPHSVYVVVDDPDAHCERAVAAGAKLVRELTDQDYGSREYGARDLEGNLWFFGTYDPLAS